MPTFPRRILLKCACAAALVAVLPGTGLGKTDAPAASAPGKPDASPLHVTLTVGDREREALVFPPSRKSGGLAPVVFAFHGHGGTAQGAARSFHFQDLWPEALVVYMQGLPTPGRLTDPEGKRNGWQAGPGLQGDRDLQFFDALLAKLRKDYPVDNARIYATGHSNGGGFTYVLWAARAAVFAAFAPSAAVAPRGATLPPKPALHLAGEQDPLVRFAWQQAMMARVRQSNGCAATGQVWATHCMLYPSTNNAPFIAYVHPGTHVYPPEAPALTVKFFKEHALTPAATP